MDIAAEEAKKLAQRCKALEAQLRQTITKKEHHQIVLEFEDKLTEMEKTIANQEKTIAEDQKELARTKAEFQKTAVLSRQLSEIQDQVVGVYKNTDAQGRSVDSLISRISQGTVPTAIHQASLTRINELEERMNGMVNKSDYFALQKRYEEATRRINSMVPSSEHEALKGRVQELESTVSGMVPKENFDSSEQMVKELKAKLAEHVPQSAYDELISKVVQLAEEVTGGEPSTEDQVESTQPEPSQPQVPAPAEQGQSAKADSPLEPITVQVPAVTAETSPRVSESPEIREVGSKLAEIKVDVVTEAKPSGAPPVEQNPKKDEVERESETVGATATHVSPDEPA